MRDRVLGTLLLGFIIGVFIRSLIVVPQIFIYVLLAFGLLFFIWSLFSKKHFFLILLAGFFFVSFMLGLLRFQIADQNHGDVSFQQFIGKAVVVGGIITDEPDIREQSVKLTIAVSMLNGRNIKIPTSVLVTTSNLNEFSYGDAVTIMGTLKTPDNFLTNTGKEFDYISYLGKDNIYFTMGNARVFIVSHDNGSWVMRGLFMVKESFLRHIESVLPKPESSLLGGLLLGTKQSLGEELRQDFVTTGTIHIVALSGYNVTIVAVALMRFFRLFLSQTISIWFGIIGIILFCLLSGGSSTAVRASVMAILALIARATGRTYDLGRALFIALFIMLLFNPKLLVFDISFQLSFLATMGLIYIAPILAPKLLFIKYKGLREIASATISAQIAVLPFILYKMGTLSLIALPINLIILPFVPLTMLVGFIAGGLAFVSHLLALPVAIGAYGLLHGMLFLIVQSANIPYASLSITQMPILLVIGIYAIILWWVYKSKNNMELKQK